MITKINIKTNGKQSTTIDLKPLSGYQSLRESLPEEQGICLPEKGQQKWGQPSFLWERVPKSGSNNREGPLPCPHQMCL